MLLVEDNADVAEALRLVLELEGHDVFVASDALEGLRIAQERQPEVIISDIGLPGMDGYAFARTLRQDAAFRSIPLLALTAYSDHESAQKAREAGMDHFMTKPANPDALLRAVARFSS